MLDEIGADSGSTTVNPQGELVVARPEAIYLYSTDGRGPCFVFEGESLQADALLLQSSSCNLKTLVLLEAGQLEKISAAKKIKLSLDK